MGINGHILGDVKLRQLSVRSGLDLAPTDATINAKASCAKT